MEEQQYMNTFLVILVVNGLISLLAGYCLPIVPAVTVALGMGLLSYPITRYIVDGRF